MGATLSEIIPRFKGQDLRRDNQWTWPREEWRRYKSLTPDEVDLLVSHALALEGEDGQADREDILTHIACALPQGLRGHHGALIEHGVFYPPWIYREADAAARDRLVELCAARIESEEGVFIPEALAWIGDEQAESRFAEWTRHGPPWETFDDWSANAIAWGAGWELTEDGRRRDLFHHECIALVASATDAQPATAVSVALPAGESCPWCGLELTVLFDLDLRGPRLAFVPFQGDRLRIVTCESCTIEQTLFARVDADGNGRWHESNRRPLSVREPADKPWIPQGRLVPTDEPRGWYEAVGELIHGPKSQVGGYPTWIGAGGEFPDCPECGKAMPFLAQIDMADFPGRIGEGIYYAFLCADCRITATSYDMS